MNVKSENYMDDDDDDDLLTLIEDLIYLFISFDYSPQSKKKKNA